MLQWNEVRSREYSDLRALLRYKTLEAEMGNTDESIQVLRYSMLISHSFN